MLVGCGAVGAQAARQLAVEPEVEQLVIVRRHPGRWVRAGAVGRVPLGQLGPPTRVRVIGGAMPSRATLERADVTIVTAPGVHRAVAEAALAAGSHVVAATDEVAEVGALLELGGEAVRVRRSLVVGTTLSPGLSCVLARFAGRRLDRVDEVHVASLGTGGPDCARRHHRALRTSVREWQDGQWKIRAGGSGREMVWFPDPVGGADCYRAARPDPVLLAAAFPRAQRLTVRLAATRRDRFTSWLPMLRPPHPEGLVGAVRVEVRGRLHGAAEVLIYGAAARPALVAGRVTALAGLWAGTGRLEVGAAGLAQLLDQPGAFLADLAARGVATTVFAGSLD